MSRKWDIILALLLIALVVVVVVGGVWGFLALGSWLLHTGYIYYAALFGAIGIVAVLLTLFIGALILACRNRERK